MQRSRLYRNIYLSALGATISLGALLATALFFGTTQQDFESLAPADQYARRLIAAEIPLRIILTLDNVFILSYCAAFVLLGAAHKRKSAKLTAVAATAILLITGLLDLLENHHILVMLESSLTGIPLTQTEIAERAQLSMLKFHGAYLGLFLLAFVLPQDTFTERLLLVGIRFVLIPAGILVYTVIGPLTAVLAILRYAAMLGGFGLLAYNYFVRSRGRHLELE